MITFTLAQESKKIYIRSLSPIQNYFYEHKEYHNWHTITFR